MKRAALLGGMPVVGRKSGDRLGDERSGYGYGCEKRENELLHDALHEGNGSQKPVVEACNIELIRTRRCGVDHISRAQPLTMAAGSCRQPFCIALQSSGGGANLDRDCRPNRLSLTRDRRAQSRIVLPSLFQEPISHRFMGWMISIRHYEG
jgi:hypothetical protein